MKLSFLLVQFICMQVFAGHMRLHVSVIGEDQIPVTNAIVKISKLASPVDRFFDSPQRITETNSVDGTGCWQRDMALHSASVFLSVSALGYYPADTNVRFRIKRDSALLGPTFVSETSSINLVLRKRINPIPMYSSKGYRRMPKEGEVWGFDLQKADWVGPHGRGETADFFVGYRSWQTNESFRSEGEITFPRFSGYYVRPKLPVQGIVSSYRADTNATFETRLTCYATRDEQGYRHKILLEDTEYIVLRTRVKVDAQGRVQSAHYSKIYGPITLRNREFAYLEAFFNPQENDTNLEFDHGRNLLKNR